MLVQEHSVPVLLSCLARSQTVSVCFSATIGLPAAAGAAVRQTSIALLAYLRAELQPTGLLTTGDQLRQHCCMCLYMAHMWAEVAMRAVQEHSEPDCLGGRPEQQGRGEPGF